MPEEFEVQEIQSFKPQAKRDFSRVGFALFAMFLVGQLVQGVLGIVLNRVWPTYAEDVPVLYWVVMFVPIYCVAFPVCLAILRKVPTDREIAAHPAEGESMSFFRWIRLLPVTFFLMYSGSLIGTAFSLILSKVIPTIDSSAAGVDPLLELLSGPGLIPRILVVCVIGPFVEEYVFRKQLIDRTRIYGEELSVLFSAVMFGLFHGNLKQGVYAALLGLLLGYVYLRTRNILDNFGIHACVNFVGGVIAPAAASGGGDVDLTDLSSMTEVPASLLVFGACVIVLFLLGGILFVALWKKVRFLPAERELQGREKNASWQNPGVILFGLLGLGSVLLMFVLGITF